MVVTFCEFLHTLSGERQSQHSKNIASTSKPALIRLVTQYSMITQNKLTTSANSLKLKIKSNNGTKLMKKLETYLYE